MFPVGPSWLSTARGAVAVARAYTWALAARIGGRPMVFGALALALGITVLVLDLDALRQREGRRAPRTAADCERHFVGAGDRAAPPEQLAR